MAWKMFKKIYEKPQWCTYLEWNAAMAHKVFRSGMMTEGGVASCRNRHIDCSTGPLTHILQHKPKVKRSQLCTYMYIRM